MRRKQAWFRVALAAVSAGAVFAAGCAATGDAGAVLVRDFARHWLAATLL